MKKVSNSFQNVIKKLKEKPSKNTDCTSTCPLTTALPVDVEVDGFVLVGQTNDEKTIVPPDDDRNKEAPPNYEEFSESDMQTESQCSQVEDLSKLQNKQSNAAKCLFKKMRNTSYSSSNNVT